MILGIDPGLTGALALVTNDGKRIERIDDMPVIEKIHGKGKMVSPAGIADIIHGIKMTHQGCYIKAYLEQVSAMPGQGVSSMFSFGRSLGVVEGVLASFNISVSYVTPMKWKRHFSLIKKDKDTSRTLILQMYPDYSIYFKRKKDVGRADSLLIALYGVKNEME